MISIAAELAAMHPQTLRLYERRGLLQPRRSAKNTRLYSQADVDRLQRIQELTELGLNLAGVERVLALEAQVTAITCSSSASKHSWPGPPTSCATRCVASNARRAAISCRLSHMAVVRVGKRRR